MTSQIDHKLEISILSQQCPIVTTTDAWKPNFYLTPDCFSQGTKMFKGSCPHTKSTAKKLIGTKLNKGPEQ